MMREIKLRGKRVDNGEWVEGNFFYWIRYGIKIPIIGQGIQNGSVIGFQVDPETVEQYTGLKDKNGLEIYEGDKLEFTDYDPSHEDIYLNKGVVKYSGFGFDISNRHSVDMDDIVVDELKVIGNIHENKEQ